MEKETNIKRKPHPRQNANVFSIMSLGYTLPIFKAGFKKDILEDEIPECVNDYTSEKLGDIMENAWKKEISRSKKPSLIRVIGSVYGFRFGLLGLLTFTNEIFIRIPQPLALAKLITYFTQPDQVSRNEAYMYAGIIAMCAFLSVICTHTYMLSIQQMGMKLRIGMCSLVYRKTLRLSKTALGGTTVGQVVNLLSNDVSRCDQSLFVLHVLWICPTEMIIVVTILYYLIGIEAAAGILCMVLLIPMQMFLGKKASKFRMQTALRTDERIRLMNEIITGIQVIKMYTWEIPFTKLVALTRKLEIKQIRSTSYVRGILISFVIFTSRVAVFVTILVYVSSQEMLTAEYVFAVTAFYNILRQTLTQQLPRAFVDIAEITVSIRRITNFLLYDEIKYEESYKNGLKVLNQSTGKCLDASLLNMIAKPMSNETDELEDKDVAIQLNNASAKWCAENNNNTLNNISIKIFKNQTVAIIGSVGSGKSSILNIILKELSLNSGSVRINGSISYAAQEPWVFASTIRQNILFGEKMDEERYQEVIRVCSLTSDLKMFPFGDNTIVGERGVTLSGGQRARVNLARAIYKKADIYLLDDPLSAVDIHVSKQLFDNCINEFLKDKCVVLVTHQVQFLSSMECIFVMDNGHLRQSGSYTYLRSSSTEFTKQLMENEEKKKEVENIEQEKSKAIKNEEKQQVEVKEHRSYGKIISDVYFSYFRAGGSNIAVIAVAALTIFTQILGSFTDYFLTYWVNLEQRQTKNFSQDETLTREYCIYIYSSTVSLLVIIVLVRSTYFYTYCMRASTNLHNNMFSSVVKAPMLFFNTNPSGRILNRFSKDLGTVDEILPMVSLDFFQITLSVIGVAIVIGTVNPWLLLVTVIIILVFYLLRVVYLRTNRSLKRLEGITKSPVFTHISASLQGLSTIRAFSAQSILQDEFDKHQNLHSSVYYSYVVCSRAFAAYLDLICVVYIATVTFSFLLIKNEQYGGNVGLAITQAIGLTGMFQWGMRQWTELETQMTAVERVLEYTKLEPEHNPQEQTTPKSWPENGRITFSAVSLKYSSTSVYVLKDLHFDIRSNEKIGIVGRTGAGKSSLMYALFQLAPTEGEIIIDDVNVSKITLQSLRSKLSIIPQEPVLFSGTMRKNLDPFEEYSDTDLWSALEEVELKPVIAASPLGLNDKVSEGGSNFSVGQRQLICLARAIVRKNKILLMDEATANIDQNTDQLIQNTIRKKFKDCTVLTIAHRINTVMDSDKILVMNAGRVVEFDHPHVLLENKETLFYSMVQQTGSSISQTLTEIAKQNYLNKTSVLTS